MGSRDIKYIIYLLLLLGLLAEMLIDVREKRIWLPLLYIEFPVLMGLNYYLGQGSIQLWIASIGIGSIFLIISFVTKGQIGKGDAALFVITGAGIGFFGNLLLIYMTFLFAFIWSAFLVVIKRVNRKKEIPLTPFLLMSYVVWLAKEIFV